MISRWEDLSVSRRVPPTRRYRLRQPLRPEAVAASYAPAEACVSAWEPSPGTLQGRPREKGLGKFRSQWSSASQSNLSAQQPIRRAKMIQVKKKKIII